MSKPRSAMLGALKAIEELGPKATNKQIMYVSGIGANSITSAIENLLMHGLIRKTGARATRRVYVTDEGRTMLYPPAPTMRGCLQCGTEFASEWEGNRICNPCKETEVWKASEVTEYTVMHNR